MQRIVEKAADDDKTQNWKGVRDKLDVARTFIDRESHIKCRSSQPTK